MNLLNRIYNLSETNVILSGEAQPKTDKDGNEIEGQYSLNGYDLVRSGSDLIITKAGTITNLFKLSKLSGDGLTSSISSAKNKITIQDFSFENSKGAFGISLGKTTDLYVGDNGELVSGSRSGYEGNYLFFKFTKQITNRFLFFLLSFLFISINSSFATSTDTSDSNHKYYYFTHKIIEKECKKFTDSCDYDKNSESQLHGNALIIFYNKAILEQTNDYSTFYKSLKNGEFKIKTDKGTTISFESSNGEVIDLKILDGDLQKEKMEKSECAISPMLFNFYYSYSRTKEIMINDDSYIGGQIFKENKNPQKIRAIFFEGELPVYTPDDNKKICKVIKGSKEYFYDHYYMTFKGYKNYKCEDYLILDKCNVILYKGKFKLPDVE